MKSSTRIAAMLLLGALVACGALLAQTPAPAQPATPGQPPAAAPAPQAVPSGIQTLPTPSMKETVAPNEVVLTIGPEKLTREQYERLKLGLPPQYAAAPQQMGDRAFAGSYAQFRGLALLAEREKLDQTPEFKEQLNFLRTELLARLALNSAQTKSQQISPEETKAYYDSHQAEMKQTKLHGIFVALNPPAKAPAPAAAPVPGTPAPKAEPPKPRTDEEAKARAAELRKQILEGADFATVAKANSDHLASAEKGGDFGTVRSGMLPASLDQVVFKLKPKEISEPTKEGQGYYIFQVDEVRPVTLDEATATIRNALQQEKMRTTLENVKTEFPVVLNDQYFGPAAPAAGRPVITGVAPAKPGAAAAPATPAPAAKPPRPAPAPAPRP